MHDALTAVWVWDCELGGGEGGVQVHHLPSPTCTHPPALDDWQRMQHHVEPAHAVENGSHREGGSVRHGLAVPVLAIQPRNVKLVHGDDPGAGDQGWRKWQNQDVTGCTGTKATSTCVHVHPPQTQLGTHQVHTAPSTTGGAHSLQHPRGSCSQPTHRALYHVPGTTRTSSG